MNAMRIGSDYGITEKKKKEKQFVERSLNGVGNTELRVFVSGFSNI